MSCFTMSPIKWPGLNFSDDCQPNQITRRQAAQEETLESSNPTAVVALHLGSSGDGLQQHIAFAANLQRRNLCSTFRKQQKLPLRERDIMVHHRQHDR